jgi:hypothetical protein
MFKVYNKVDGVLSEESMLVPETVLESSVFLPKRRVEDFMKRLGLFDLSKLNLCNKKNTNFILLHSHKGYFIEKSPIRFVKQHTLSFEPVNNKKSKSLNPGEVASQFENILSKISHCFHQISLNMKEIQDLVEKIRDSKK